MQTLHVILKLPTLTSHPFTDNMPQLQTLTLHQAACNRENKRLAANKTIDFFYVQAHGFAIGYQWASIYTHPKEIYALFDFQLIAISLVYALSYCGLLLPYGCRVCEAIFSLKEKHVSQRFRIVRDCRNWCLCSEIQVTDSLAGWLATSWGFRCVLICNANTQSH